MEFDREWIVPLERTGTRILVRHGGRPVTHYAAMLQVLQDSQWHTIRLIDNAHEAHHMHPVRWKPQAGCRTIWIWRSS